MTELLHAAAAFPTVLYTVMLGVALIYWVFVIVGALDLDLLGGDADVDLGGGDGIDGGGDGFDVDGSEGGHGISGALSGLGLTKVPLTVALTVVLLGAWVTCLLSMRYLGIVLGDPILTWVIGPAVFVGSLIPATLAAAVIVRPLAPVFDVKQAKTRSDYIGTTCEITTGRVDGDFGQANVEDGGTVLVIPVRCDKPDAKLGRGTRALIIDYDDERHAYVVEPYENVLGGRET
jgi:hypothetical protein